MDKQNRYRNYIIIANEFLCQESYLKALHFFKKAYYFAVGAKEKTDALYEIADILLILENISEAQEKYEEILRWDPNQAGAYYGLSLSNELLEGDIFYSIENYKKAIDIDPHYDRAYYYLGHLYDKVGQLENAKKCFQKCIELDPYDYVSYNDLGSLYENKGEYEIALEMVEQSLFISPTYGRALFNMGVICREMGKSALAMDYYEKSLEEFHSSDLFLNMSAIYIEWKEYERAIQILDCGMQDFNDSVNLHYNKACCLNLLGHCKEALEELKSAIQIEPQALQWAAGDSDLCDLIKELRW